MQTHLPLRQEGDIMPHQHFNEYIYYINQYLNKNEIEKKEVLKNILDRIREESDIISHWGQNGTFSAIAPGDMNDLSTMPCDKDYYIKIENPPIARKDAIRILHRSKNKNTASLRQIPLRMYRPFYMNN